MVPFHDDLSAEEAWDQEVAAREAALSMTDAEVAALGLKEYAPGYYHHDPRYPGVDPETRYLLDHAAPSWAERRQQAPPPRVAPNVLPLRQPAWDDEMLSGQTFESWTGTVTSEPKKIPLTAGPADTLPFTVRRPRTTTSLWLCQVCRTAQAEWPREISWQRIVWGLRFSLVLRSPFACTNCRILRFKEQQAIGHRDHRPFWSQVIALMTGVTQSGTIDGIRWINRRRRDRSSWLRRSATCFIQGSSYFLRGRRD